MFWIIVSFLFGLWPVGIFLLLRKAGLLSVKNQKTPDRTTTSWAAVFAIVGLLALKFSPWACFYLLLGSGVLLLSKRYMKKKAQRDQKYIALTANHVSVPLEEIARAMPTTVAEARRDLERIIGEGRLGKGAYLDMSRKLLVLDPTRAEPAFSHSAEDVIRAASADPRTAPRQPLHETPQSDAMKRKPVAVEMDEYAQKLEEIRRLNRDIEDEAVSGKIDRIEEVTSGIFEAIKANEGKKNQARSFLNYYLPTTLKLLSRYAELEENPNPGPNVRTAMQNISDTLDKVITNFEALLDSLYQDDVIDITSEISALEVMMSKDGVSENPYSFETLK